ncbi:PP2C family protein-serine/threonine phosphatase [Streptomyces sp. AK02-01A]|uniref:PP2C family protein-serine/threonine phosphatase n=1 Tax=Streptomyces sp. AK02-01A TaxID=3028648 RepID=UPI0029B54C0F|nr:PP2C family protein-serine/threonine phosphatase [Streptomyces sp. AK02-01A]MDX3854324.1 PP2C family protein-serine/threonine phosphatase [Streptomyces sp. AK02-01A]
MARTQARFFLPDEPAHRSIPELPRGIAIASAIIPYVLVAAYSLAALLTGPGLRWLSMLATAPALAAARYGPYGVVAFGAASFVIAVMLGLRPGSPSMEDQSVGLVALAVVTTASALLSALRQRRERELVAVRSVAEAAQQAILAPVPERVGPLRIAVRYSAAAAEASIGGDLYGVVLTPFGPRAIMADVRGKGLPAVSTAALVLGIFREAAHNEPNLLHVVDRIERSLRRNLAGDDFVTSVIVGFPSPCRLQVANCGHVPPLLVHQGTVTAIDAEPPVPPLGLLELSDAKPCLTTLPFTEGDQLLLYTDGVSEARDHNGAFFPLEERLRQHLSADSTEMLDALLEKLLDHNAGRLDDDAALLLIQLPAR